MTSNVAHNKKAIEVVSGFDETLTYFENRNLALKIMRLGEIRYNPDLRSYATRD